MARRTESIQVRQKNPAWTTDVLGLSHVALAWDSRPQNPMLWLIVDSVVPAKKLVKKRN